MWQSGDKVSLMRVLSIVGARPQFVKLAPISWSSQGVLDHFILHTGQHYDYDLSEQFFKDLNLGKPDWNLQVGSGMHGVQTGKMLIGIEKILSDNEFDHIIVYGDTNTTLAGAIVAAKLNIPVSHVEAGLRSFNRRMPEELNRIIADHASNLLFAPTKNAMENLKKEGLIDKSKLVGDITLETLETIVQLDRGTSKDSDKTEFIYATIHRAQNTDDRKRLAKLLGRFERSLIPVHLHCHPRLRKSIESLGLDRNLKNTTLFPPLSFIESIRAINNAAGVITDSGGLQKEAYILKKPCLIARFETEWTETIHPGGNRLDPELAAVSTEWWNDDQSQKPDLFGDGATSKSVIAEILNYV
jgi:UDP-N-acetylglucosamine 2-epimerase